MLSEALTALVVGASFFLGADDGSGFLVVGRAEYLWVMMRRFFLGDLEHSERRGLCQCWATAWPLGAVAALLTACGGGDGGNFTPKPKGYNRIDLPAHYYQPLGGGHPYTFEYSKWAVVRRDSQPAGARGVLQGDMLVVPFDGASK